MLPALAYARRSWRVFGSGAAPDAFAIGGNSPELVAAFTTQSDGTTAGEYYRKASSETTFDGLFTHSVSGLLTMFDSTGTLVWAPHNTLSYSEDFTQSYWTKIGLTFTAGPTFNDFSTTKWVSSVNLERQRINRSNPFTSAQGGNIRVYGIAKAAEWDYFIIGTNAPGIDNTNFDLTNGVIDGQDHDNAGIESLGDGWYLCWVEEAFVIGTDPSFYTSNSASGSSNVQGDGSSGIYVFAVGAYHNDLGGMADNPDQTVSGLEKYVPTTTAAKYLPRRQAYRYNSGWELAGMQLEAAAATQLLHGTDSFATQTETVTAQAYTLQFRGTGSITLSGAHLATLNGTGANDLVSLTFTPSAGTLTLTPSGTVNYPQLETGSIPTSYIPNTAASGTVTRAAETLTIARSNLPSLTDTTPWWFLLDYRMWDEATRQNWLRITDANDEFFLRHEGNRLKAVARTPNDGVETVSYAANYSTNYTEFDARLAHRFTTSEHGGSLSGEAYISKAMTEVPVLPGDPLDFTNDEFNGFIREFRFGTGEPSSSALVEASA